MGSPGFLYQIGAPRQLALVTKKLANSHPLQYETIIGKDALSTEQSSLSDVRQGLLLFQCKLIL